jgi:MoaA/NifB/PqqE/SkfB family radical SAM enzyme
VQALWLTLRCNNACAFCPQQQARLGPESPFFERSAIEARLLEAVSSGQPLAFVGGEPTLHPELFDLLRLARQHGARELVIQTNGRRLAYTPYTRGLREAGATGVDVSLHGSTAAIHDFHTRTGGSFAQTLTGLGVARGVGLRVGVTSVVTRSNFRHLAELVRLVGARGAQALNLALAEEPPGASLPPSLRPSPDLVKPYLAEALRVGQRLGVALRVEGLREAEGWGSFFVGVGLAQPPSLDR